MTPLTILRSTLALIVGILVISLIVEALEFGLVTLINGERVTDPESYYAVRNRGWVLTLKLMYNTSAAFGAGYVTARIAGHSEVMHGLGLAIIQTLSFAWALTQPEMRQWTPMWMWAALIVLTFVGIVAGAVYRIRRVGLVPD